MFHVPGSLFVAMIAMPKIRDKSIAGERRETFQGCVPPVVDAKQSGNANATPILIGEFREHSARAKTLETRKEQED
jgi:hypothetical protein